MIGRTLCASAVACAFVAAFIATACRGAAPQAAATQPTTRSAGRAALAAQCDALMASAVRTPFGWGWAVPSEDEPAPPVQRDAPGRAGAGKRAAPKAPAARGHEPVRPPTIDAQETAAIGVQLLWAGELLAEPRYREAAFEAGRGITGIQTHTGQVRSRGVMAAFGGAKDALGDVPDRAATRAALGLWLSLIDSARKEDAPAGGATGNAAPRPSGSATDAYERRNLARIRPATAQAAHWLGQQQSPSGAWPSAFPPGAAPGKATRIVRLDLPDFRDDTIAILLASEVLESHDLRLLADRALDEILELRLPRPGNLTRSLWGSAYTLGNDPLRRFQEFYDGIDALASRYAMQALLADYLLTLRPRGDAAVREAVTALRALPREKQTLWYRHYTRRGDGILPSPTTRPRGLFHEDDVTQGGALGTFGLDRLLQAGDRIAQEGGDRFGRSLGAVFPMRDRLAAMLCGLSEEPMLGRLTAEAGAGPSGADSETVPSERVLDLWRSLREEIEENGKK